MLRPTKNHEIALTLAVPNTDGGKAVAISPISSEELLRGRNEVQIAHGGCLYSLRQTRQGKLILTK